MKSLTDLAYEIMDSAEMEDLIISDQDDLDGVLVDAALEAVMNRDTASLFCNSHPAHQGVILDHEAYTAADDNTVEFFMQDAMVGIVVDLCRELVPEYRETYRQG